MRTRNNVSDQYLIFLERRHGVGLRDLSGLPFWRVKLLVDVHGGLTFA